jgi:hypothetical protein
MKSLLIISSFLLSACLFAQEESTEEKKDTTRINFGKTTEFIIVNKDGKTCSGMDTVDASSSDEDIEKSLAHWEGIELGFNMLLNSNNNTSFPNNPHWNIDPAKSTYLNLNLWSHKFNIVKHYVGITTGAGFNFNSIAFKNNYLLMDSPDSLYAVMDTTLDYSKNKLKASYFQIPVLLEFNTSTNKDKCFYLAAGVIGGVRISSKLKREVSNEHMESEYKKKGTFGLNPFKCDATVRMGYGSWGVFGNYSLIPMFDEAKTEVVRPVTFGLTYSF